MSQPKPIILSREEGLKSSFSALGKSMVIHEWSGSGPPYMMYVHYHDDEAWHIREGELTFKFIDNEIIASKGTRSLFRQELPTPTSTTTALVVIS